MKAPSARAFVRVRVVPRAARTALARDAAGVLRAHVTAPPVEGAANRAVLDLLAATLGLPRRRLEIAQGERGRDKLVCVHGCSRSEVESRLATALGSGVDKTTRHG